MVYFWAICASASGCPSLAALAALGATRPAGGAARLQPELQVQGVVPPVGLVLAVITTPVLARTTPMLLVITTAVAIARLLITGCTSTSRSLGRRSRAWSAANRLGWRAAWEEADDRREMPGRQRQHQAAAQVIVERLPRRVVGQVAGVRPGGDRVRRRVRIG
jgi:hypothetical protein